MKLVERTWWRLFQKSRCAH